MAAFTSSISVPADQLADAPQLEPAFEHLLRNSSVHESIIQTLRVNAITDRDTFVNMFDSEAALKEGASDLGFDLTSGGLPHKREFARVVTSWKTAKVMSETKLQTDAVARAHGVPVTLLPCDWTSLITEFKNKHGKHIPEDKLPAQSMFENFSERLADGTLKAEPLSHVVSLFEEEQQDSKRPDPTRQYNLQLDSKLTITSKRRHLSTEPRTKRDSASSIRSSRTSGCSLRCGSQGALSILTSIAIPLSISLKHSSTKTTSTSTRKWTADP